MSLTEEVIRGMGIILGPILTPIAFVGSGVAFTADQPNYTHSVVLLVMGIALLVITLISYQDFLKKK